MTSQIIIGDCLEILPTLETGSIQACITSPPYWGLRDYGTAEWEGGDPACDHQPPKSRKGGESEKQNSNTGSWGTREWLTCGKCGAVRMDKQLGLERLHDCLGWATGEPCGECYVCHTVAWAREVRRVLRDDGTLWVVIGDSYAGSMKGMGTNGKAYPGKKQATNKGSVGIGATDWVGLNLKPKDLVGIPWRVALALQADGWWLRSDVIWAKPNPMPESVRDRPTKAHEYVFLFSKSPRYYWDQDAVRETAVSTHGSGNGYKRDERLSYKDAGGPRGNDEPWKVQPTRNLRTVWTVATQPYAEAHFATYPPALVETMIAASSREGDTILDPFGGAGTTGLVASRLGRLFVIIDLNPHYARLSERRIRADAPLLADLIVKG